MAWVPKYFQASTQEIAEQALEKGVVKYPSIGYVKQGNYFVWVTQEGTLVNVGGYDQITDVQYTDGILSFMSGSKILYAVKIGITPEIIDEIKNEVMEDLDLASYMKVDDAIKLIDSKIGDLGDAASVVDYLKQLSYNTLLDIPIKNEYGSLTKTIVVSELPDGIYRVSGQFKIGGDSQTIQMSSEDSLFLIMRNDEFITITHLLSNSIKIYSIDSTGVCTVSQYITEQWINDKDFVTSSEIAEYVREIVGQSVEEIVDSTLDAKLDANFSAIPDADIISIFI